MMKSLLCKEWLGLRPFALLLASIWAVGIALTLMLDFPDEYPLWESLMEESATTSGLLLLFAFLLSLGLLTREKEERTLDFLDGLPLSRSAVFWGKWLVALFILLGFLLLITLEALAYDALSRTSLSQEFPWRSLGLWLALQGLFCTVVLSLGLVLAYLRWLSFLALALLFWAVWWMTQSGLPLAQWINPFNLVTPPAGPDAPWPLPWTHIRFQCALAALLTLTALSIFQLRDSAWSRRLARACSTRIARVILALGMFAIPVAWIGFLMANSEALQKLAEEGDEGAALTTEALSKLTGGNEILERTTDHYLFSYRKHQEPVIRSLFPKADEVFHTVAGFLQAPHPDQGSRIVVDLCHPLQQHFAGLAYWKKIRMSLDEGKSLSHHLAVLGHETTHVLLNLLSASRAGEDFNSIRWFHEGLASYGEYRFFRSPEELLQSNRSLALSATWHQVDFNELIDDETLSRKRDNGLVYTAGRLWCEALVAVYGDQAPARLIAAIANPSRPRQTVAISRWRQICQTAGFDLERVGSRFRRRLEELRQEHAAACKVFPRLEHASLSRDSTAVLITPALPPAWRDGLPKGAHPVCRIRQDQNEPPFLQRSVRLGQDEAFSFPASWFLKPSFEYALGWHTGEWSHEPVWGEWTRAVTP